MIDKQEFRHGAAIVRVLEDCRCKGVAKHSFGYLVNDKVLAYLKYSTRHRSPWRFSFSSDEIERLNQSEALYGKEVVLALICGGDGVCAIYWDQARQLLGNAPAWISAKRNFNERYAVAGPLGSLPKKVPLQQWPAIIFNACGSESASDAAEGSNSDTEVTDGASHYS